jgi:predicted AAA+ superfamily ATPase
MFIARSITKKLEELLPEKQMLIVTGMRRVGKTTQLRHLYNQIPSSNKLFLDLEDILLRKIFSSDNYQDVKKSLENEGIVFTKPQYIFIDEIQLVPNLPSILKYFYDSYQTKFVVSGSSSYYIKNHFTESLAGRKFILELFPLSFQEFLQFKNISKKDTPPSFAQKTSLKSELDQQKYQSLYAEYITYGGFPDVVLATSHNIKQSLLSDIINSYFQLDVTTLADFSDIPYLRDLLLLLTQRIGQKMNITNLANALHISRKKVYDYLAFLQSTYVIRTVSQSSSIDNQVSADDKCYFTDTGLANYLQPIKTGNQFENSVFMNLHQQHQLTYFQTQSGKEIDFVLNKKIGIEVKETASKQDLANLLKRANSLGISDYYIVSYNYVDHPRVIMPWDL